MFEFSAKNSTGCICFGSCDTNIKIILLSSVIGDLAKNKLLVRARIILKWRRKKMCVCVCARVCVSVSGVPAGFGGVQPPPLEIPRF
jgi:hypothetical protein